MANCRSAPGRDRFSLRAKKSGRARVRSYGESREGILTRMGSDIDNTGAAA
jgi:hypothetical protein